MSESSENEQPVDSEQSETEETTEVLDKGSTTTWEDLVRSLSGTKTNNS